MLQPLDLASRSILITCLAAATASAQAPYCPSGTGVVSCKMDPWIRRTQFVTIDYTGDCWPPYVNLTPMSAAVLRGVPNLIRVQLNNLPDPGGYTRVFVDWNQDLDFFDAGEEFILTDVGSLCSGPITAPANALLGPTRMRVSTGGYFGPPPTPCQAAITQDYTLEVCTDVDGDGVLDCHDNCLLPNPSQADCDGNGIGDLCDLANGTHQDCDGNGVPDVCEPDCNHTGLPDACDIAAGTSLDVNSNGVPDECEAANGLFFCGGEGSFVSCPCGNETPHNEGCVNSTGRGARLYNGGGTSVSADDALPTAIGMPPNKPMVFIAGVIATNNGLGVPFFDGLLCVQPYRRYPVQLTTAGGTAVLNSPVLGAHGMISAGVPTYFQAWYRDGAASPCGTGANLSNGLRILFTP
jgi:hypothetical protein